MSELKFITTFVLTSPRAARPALAAITDAGHSLRESAAAARGLNINTMEYYEAWQTTMPVAEVELLAVEADGAIISVGPTPEDLQ